MIKIFAVKFFWQSTNGLTNHFSLIAHFLWVKNFKMLGLSMPYNTEDFELLFFTTLTSAAVC